MGRGEGPGTQTGRAVVPGESYSSLRECAKQELNVC